MSNLQYFQIVGVCLVWFSSAIYTMRLCYVYRSVSVGLPAAFIFSMTFLYMGAFTYLVPGYTHLRLDAHWYLAGFGVDHQSIVTGVTITAAAILSFAIGFRMVVARPISETSLINSQPVTAKQFNIIFACLVAFAAVGFLLPVLGIRIPLGQAIEKVGQNVGIAVVCIGLYRATRNADMRAKARWYCAAFAIPIYYLLVWGFVSYGFIVSTIVLCFIVVATGRQQWTFAKLFVSVFAIGYAITALFVLYFSFREEIRGVIWSGASYDVRLIVIWDVFKELKLLNPFDFDSLDLINVRLSQTAFVGRVFDWHSEYPELRQFGGTFMLFVFAWIPRFLWPGKPAMGSSSILEDNSGLKFSDTSTFGAGPVIEFFVNFGVLGVLVGFLILGIMVGWLDRKAAIYLHSGQILLFAKFFVVGTAFIAPLTDIFFFANTAFMSWILLSLVQLGLNGTSRSSRSTSRNFALR